MAMKTDADPNYIYSNSLRFSENIFIVFFQGIFSAGNVYNLPQFKEEDDQTEIFIQPARADNRTHEDSSKPKVTVLRGPVRINSTLGVGGSMVGSRNPLTGSVQLGSLRSGMVTVSCFSRAELEADDLAEYCVEAVNSYKDVLQRAGFMSIKATQIGSRAVIETSVEDKWFVVPIVIEYELTKTNTKQAVNLVKLREIIQRVILTPEPIDILESRVKKKE